MQTVELAILNWIQAVVRCDALDAFFPVFTSLVNYGALWIALAAALCLRRSTRQAGLCVGGGLLVDYGLCNLLLKPLVGRIRPFAVNTAVELLLEAPSDPSFPSGHTAASFAAVAALYTAKSPLWKPAAAVAVLIAFSRMYLYLHWPTDILGGVAVGWLSGVLGAKLAAVLTERKQK